MRDSKVGPFDRLHENFGTFASESDPQPRLPAERRLLGFANLARYRASIVGSDSPALYPFAMPDDREIAALAEDDKRNRGREWWGEFDLAPREGLSWEVGPLSMRVDHLGRECQIRYRHEGEGLEDRLRLGTKSEPLSESVDWDGIFRIAGQVHEAPFRLVALTADRTVVSKPVDPFFVLPSESIRLFVSTPLWVGVECGQTRLCDVPTTRPSDTWVGPTIGPGEAAYANRMHCRQDLSELPFRPHRAISPIAVRNRSRQILSLERVAINLPLLSLFAGSSGRVWTEAIELSLLDDNELESSIASGPPPEALAGRDLSPSRRKKDNGSFGSALASIF